MHDGRLECVSCQVTFASNYAYTRHVAKVHTEVIDAVFLRDGLEIPENSSPEKPKNYCDGCRETFASKEQKRLHTCYSLLDKEEKDIAESRKREFVEKAGIPELEDEIYKAMEKMHNSEEQNTEAKINIFSRKFTF